MTSEDKQESTFSWWNLVKSLLFLLDEQKKKYVFYTAILVLILFYDIVPPLIIGKIVDFFTHYNDTTSLLPFYIYVAFLTIAHGVVSLLRLTTKHSLSKIQSQATYNTRVRGFERLLDFSIKWHDTENTGNKIQRIQNGTDALKQLQQILNNGVFPQITTILGVLIAFLWIQPIFFLYCLAYLAIFIAIQASFYTRMQKMNDEYNALLEKASGSYFEGLSNVLTIKTLGVKDGFKQNIASREKLSRDYAIKINKLATDKWRYFQIINALAFGGILLLTGHSFVSHIITLGSIFVFFNYYLKLSNAIGDSTSIFDQLLNFKVSIARMMPIFREQSTIKEGSLSFPAQWDTIRIHDGSFSYRKTDTTKDKKIQDIALKHINIEIKKYEKIGIVGKSGSGKSTFAKVFLGLFELDSGRFTIEYTNFYDMKHRDVTDNIALVLQDSEMFNLSLKDNITLMREIDVPLLEQAISIAQLEEFIKKLPEGIDTAIGEKGYRLSGGERQRIGIARAIYKNPQILVFDEATSSLDSKTEISIQERLERELQKKTIISIAHRVSTLKNTDRILVFENGKIVEEGTYDGLSSDRTSKFYDLNTLQQRGQTI